MFYKVAICPKQADGMANYIDSVQTVSKDLCLYCMLKPIWLNT